MQSEGLRPPTPPRERPMGASPIAKISPCGATKGLSDRPLETFGSHDLGFIHGFQSMCNHGAKPCRRKPRRPAGHILAPMEGGRPPCEAAKGLSGRPLETFGAHDLAFVHGGQSHVQPRREAKQTKTQPPAGHSPAPMEVDDRPCEAVLAGDSVIATLNMLCHGGPGGRHSCRLNLAAPRPLCYFLRGESRTKQAYALQGQNTFA